MLNCLQNVFFVEFSSRKKFTEEEVEKWWKENRLSVYKIYDIERNW